MIENGVEICFLPLASCYSNKIANLENYRTVDKANSEKKTTFIKAKTQLRSNNHLLKYVDKINSL